LLFLRLAGRSRKFLWFSAIWPADYQPACLAARHAGQSVPAL